MRAAWILFALLVACGDNNAGNRAPTAADFTLTTQEDIPIMRVIDATDSDGDELVAQAASAPAHGTATFSGLLLTYLPNSDFHGEDQFAVTVSDGTEEVAITVRVTVTSANDLPFGVPDNVGTSEDTLRSIPASLLLANDSDNDGDELTIAAVGTPVHGTVVLTGSTITFTPDANFSGDASFLYSLTDGIETVDVAVTVAVGAANDAPVAVNDTTTTAEDTDKTLTTLQLTTNDTDADNQILTISAVQNASNCSVSVDGGSGDVTVTPDANFVGDATFEYVVTDGVDSDIGLVTVTVTAVNDPPTANPDSISQTGAANPIPHATLLANDSDGGDGGTKTITAVSNPQNGTITLEAATVTFTPDDSFSGAASFDYTMSDDGGTTTSTTTVTVTVTTARVCGDGVVEAPETCDDNGIAPNDGCNATCKTETGFNCTGAPSSCVPICGDTLTVGGEQCDDGNAIETDGCTTKCLTGILCNATAFTDGDAFAVDPLNGNCYVSFDGDAIPFGSAEQACVLAGGHLATITSQHEQDIVVSVRNPAENPWIGAQDDGNDLDTIFDWVTDEPFGFSVYAALEPDDDAGLDGNGECLHIADANGAWGDTNCNNPSSFVVGRVCEFEVAHCGNGITEAGEQCDDGGNADGDGCTATCENETLFFSEYIEGSSSNKALEIKNPSSTTPFNLATNTCQIRLFTNGNAVGGSPVNLTGTIAVNDVFVLCNPGASAAVLSLCDQTSGTINFNGNDAVQLSCNGTVLDVIGQIGFDPVTEWGTGLTSTQDNTIRRKCGISHGDPDGTNDFNPTLAAQWTGFALDTFAGLGDPACAP